MTSLSSGAISIRAAGIRKSFPLHVGSLMSIWLGKPETGERYEALKGIDLQVPEGEFLGVLGANGAGKSTLLRVLAGVYTPDTGTATINGDCASLFELGGLGNTQLTGREFTLLYLQLYGVSPQDIPALLEDIHEFSELDDYFDRKVLTYSAGMKARLYFAAATSAQHAIYLIDEVLSVGDEHFQVKSRKRMNERLTNGASGVLVTHDWSAVVRLCRSASVLSGGKLSPPAAASTTVASYLDLAPPQTDIARFVVEPTFRLKSNEPLRIEFEVVVLQDAEVELAVSLDMLQSGVGWEPIILSEYEQVGSTIGHYQVQFSIPYTPMSAGTYQLCLFLGGKDPNTGARLAYDVRSWTYGNALPLIVDGETRPDVAPFPVTWAQLA